MTDQEWHEMRDGWRSRCKDGLLGCHESMIPYALDRLGYPWMWVSRKYVEDCDRLTDTPEFKASVEMAKKSLGK